MADDTKRIVPQEPAAPPAEFQALAHSNGRDDAPLVVLFDGRRITLARPKGSIIAQVVKITAELTRGMTVGEEPQLVAMTYLEPYVKALLHVRSIEGKPTMPITGAESYQALADNLTDDGIAEVQRAILEHWPPPTAEHRAEIKKNRPRPDLS